MAHDVTVPTANTNLYDPAQLFGHLVVRNLYGGFDDPAVIFLHGHGGDSTAANIDDFTDDLIRQIADKNQVLSLDARGPHAWGSDPCVTEIKARYDQYLGAAGEWGLGGAPVPVFGYSMGGIAALNFARQHPGDVSKIMLIAPVTDLEWHYANGSQENIDDINAAHGPNVADRADSDPVKFAAQIAQIPVQLHYATGDTVVPPQTNIDFANAHGNTTLVPHNSIAPEHIYVWPDVVDAYFPTVDDFLNPAA